VTGPGVQELSVSASNPLILFDLDISLEWDAHKDPAYLEQLQFNLQRASEYLYDFTNGQAAIGSIDVFQNADEWAFSNVVVHTNNRLRPYANQGGIRAGTHRQDPVWIENNLVYANHLRGIQLDDAAAGAVVIHDVSPHTLVAGVPAVCKKHVD